MNRDQIDWLIIQTSLVPFSSFMFTDYLPKISDVNFHEIVFQNQYQFIRFLIEFELFVQDSIDMNGEHGA